MSTGDEFFRLTESNKQTLFAREEHSRKDSSVSIQTATPYLILGGNAKRALDLYSRALDARTETLQHFGDVDGSCPQARRDLVMHAALRIGNALIMLSDGPEEAKAPLQQGAVSVALDFDDEVELRRRFEALAATGNSIMPIFDAPWGAVFGVVQDELGISWMLNCTKPHFTQAQAQ